MRQTLVILLLFLVLTDVMAHRPDHHSRTSKVLTPRRKALTFRFHNRQQSLFVRQDLEEEFIPKPVIKKVLMTLMEKSLVPILGKLFSGGNECLAAYMRAFIAKTTSFVLDLVLTILKVSATMDPFSLVVAIPPLLFSLSELTLALPQLIRASGASSLLRTTCDHAAPQLFELEKMEIIRKETFDERSRFAVDSVFNALTDPKNLQRIAFSYEALIVMAKARLEEMDQDDMEIVAMLSEYQTSKEEQKAIVQEALAELNNLIDRKRAIVAQSIHIMEQHTIAQDMDLDPSKFEAEAWKRHIHVLQTQTQVVIDLLNENEQHGNGVIADVEAFAKTVRTNKKCEAATKTLIVGSADDDMRSAFGRLAHQIKTDIIFGNGVMEPKLNEIKTRLTEEKPGREQNVLRGYDDLANQHLHAIGQVNQALDQMALDLESQFMGLIQRADDRDSPFFHAILQLSTAIQEVRRLIINRLISSFPKLKQAYAVVVGNSRSEDLGQLQQKTMADLQDGMNKVKELLQGEKRSRNHKTWMSRCGYAFSVARVTYIRGSEIGKAKPKYEVKMCHGPSMIEVKQTVNSWDVSVNPRQDMCHANTFAAEPTELELDPVPGDQELVLNMIDLAKSHALKCYVLSGTAINHVRDPTINPATSRPRNLPTHKFEMPEDAKLRNLLKDKNFHVEFYRLKDMSGEEQRPLRGKGCHENGFCVIIMHHRSAEKIDWMSLTTKNPNDALAWLCAFHVQAHVLVTKHGFTVEYGEVAQAAISEHCGVEEAMDTVVLTCRQKMEAKLQELDQVRLILTGHEGDEQRQDDPDSVGENVVENGAGEVEGETDTQTKKFRGQD